jgi:hypothetical protein
LVVPAILTWKGPVVVTSVKSDVVMITQAWRSTQGRVQRLEPGRDDGLTWNPLEDVTTLRQALRVAQSLTRESSRLEADFWNSLAVKLLAGLFVAAQRRNLTIFDVASVVESRRWNEWITSDHVSAHVAMLRSFLDYDPKTLDSVITTAETMLLAWRFPQPVARLSDVLDGANTPRMSPSFAALCAAWWRTSSVDMMLVMHSHSYWCSTRPRRWRPSTNSTSGRRPCRVSV